MMVEYIEEDDMLSDEMENDVVLFVFLMFIFRVCLLLLMWVKKVLGVCIDNFVILSKGFGMLLKENIVFGFFILNLIIVVDFVGLVLRCLLKLFDFVFENSYVFFVEREIVVNYGSLFNF